MRCEAYKSNLRAKRDPLACSVPQNVEEPVEAHARSRAACCSGYHARRSESTYAQLVDIMSTIIGLSRLIGQGCVMAHSKTQPEHWEKPSKTQRVEREISIFQAIQLCFSRSLGSATFNGANKSVMLLAEWTITARQAVLCLAQMKYLYFVPECCK